MNCILKIIQLDDILLAGQEHFLKIRRKQEVDEKMKSKFTKLLATALVLCLVLALLPAAAFAGNTYTVSFVNKDGDVPYNGTLTVNGVELKKGATESTTIEEGTVVTVTANPNGGYQLFSISADKAEMTPSSGSYTFIMPAEAVTITAQFMPYYSIEAASDMTGGQVVYPDTAMYQETVTITATPYKGYKFVEFNVFGKDTNDTIPTTPAGENTATFQMPDHAVIVSATFEEVAPVTDTYTITCVNNSTYGWFTSDKSTAQKGEVVTISVEPKWGYYVDDIYYMASTSGMIPPSGRDFTPIGDNKWQFSMPESNVWVYVSYKPYFPGHDYHAITVTSDGHCDVSVPTWAYCGDNVTINLSNFDTGYAFSYLKVNGEYVTPYGFNGYLSYTFKMPHKDVAIEVGTTSVSGKYYIDTSYDSTLGGVEVWVNNNYVNNWHQGSWADYKDSVSFKVKPYYSDDVVSVSVVGKRTGWTYSYDYNSYSGWYTFTMPNEDVTINVDFRSGVHKAAACA